MPAAASRSTLYTPEGLRPVHGWLVVNASHTRSSVSLLVLRVT